MASVFDALAGEGRATRDFRRSDDGARLGPLRAATPKRDSDNRVVRRIGSVPVQVETRDSGVARLWRAIVDGDHGVWGFCNAHSVNVARSNPAFRDALAGAHLFNDGIGVDVASWLLYGDTFPMNLNGTDFTPALLASLPAGTPVFLLGSPAGVAERAGRALAQAHPNIRIAGTHHGYFLPHEEQAITEQIVASGARLVLVGMGQPHQELWAARNRASIAAPLLCVGAFLDFSAGRVSRAPAAVRAARAEWLYCLALEPRRLAGRYLVGNMTFLASVLRQRARH